MLLEQHCDDPAVAGWHWTLRQRLPDLPHFAALPIRDIRPGPWSIVPDLPLVRINTG